MKIKLIKLAEVDNPTHPNNKEVGYETIGLVPFLDFVEPKVGKRFFNGKTITSIVKEIINGNTFKTLNSIYEWEIVIKNFNQNRCSNCGQIIIN